MQDLAEAWELVASLGKQERPQSKTNKMCLSFGRVYYLGLHARQVLYP